MLFLGIDPGMTGAVALLTATGSVLWVKDTPVAKVERKGGRTTHEYLWADMAALFDEIPGPVHAGLEATHAMPDQGVTSMFAMGRGLGLWQGILAALEIPFVMVQPQAWKKRYSLLSLGKDGARIAAQARWPDAQLSRVKDHGRADSLFLADYTRVFILGQERAAG
jgi:crossover junction endodeoxyribonuclease RuvC